MGLTIDQRKALVASDVGGHHELIEHGRTGLLYAAGRQDSLVEQVLTLVRSPELQQGLISNGLAFVRDERTWAHSVDGYTALYESLQRGRSIGR